MPLSRLDNFLKNVRGNILYVDPNSLDATDSITNQGNSMAQPFKTIQRALIEAARFSYQVGLDNDRFEKSTIYIAPGEYLIDNRPGYIPTGASQYLQRNGLTTTDLVAFNNTTNFNINSPNNELYKLNSINGGVIVPRGVSIVGQDLRKCKIKPLYVPDPENENIDRSAIFRLTGATYLQSFTIFDAPQSRGCFKDYTTNTFDPTFSHNKLTAFEFADGANPVVINDEFLDYKTDRTDLDMYYEKISIVYGPASGRNISPDYPNPGIDIQTKIDEFRIVGPTIGEAGISSIKAGNGAVPTTTITVDLADAIFGLNVDTVVIINNVSDNNYNGTFTVTDVLATNEEGALKFTYEAANIPQSPLPSPLGTTCDLSTDTVTSASPYVFSVSMRSTYGMCGMWADGAKADGFKSMVVAQFTGISLQVDNNAFVLYNPVSGTYEDNTTVNNLHTNIDAKYKPAYENWHIKASNDAFMQLVSVFAVGYAQHFVVESGGDFSLTNSNSNFGQRALRGDGFKNVTFPQDNYGYFSQAIPPRFIEPVDNTIEFFAFDVGTTASVGNTSRLYIYGFGSENINPPGVIQGYRLGAKVGEEMSIVIPVSSELVRFDAKVVMPNTEDTTKEVTAIKTNIVGRAGAANSITASTLTFTENHNLINGESIRLISDTGRLPDGLNANTLYYAITDGLPTNQIQVAQTPNDANTGEELTINNFGGRLIVESRVSDKNSGDIGHPIQYDGGQMQWYVNCSMASTENTIYDKIETDGVAGLGSATPRSYITRTPDDRSSLDRIYRFRYVIPSSSATAARPPLPGYIIQESNTVTGASDTEVQLYYNTGSVTMSNDAQMRNFSFIADVDYRDGLGIFTTELPHHLNVGSKVRIENVTSTEFTTTGFGFSGYNGFHEVVGVSSQLQFEVSGISSSPGAFTNDTSVRNTSLPTFARTKYNGTFYIYDVEEVEEYLSGEQDGVYDIIMLDSDCIPSVSPFSTTSYSFTQPVRNLFPQKDRDNPNDNPEASVSYALPDNLGEVVVNDPQKSITREALGDFYIDTMAGLALTNITTNETGSEVNLQTNLDHGLNPVTRVSIDNSGGGYGTGGGSAEVFYNARLENVTGGSIGRNATGVVEVNASGQITNVEIMSGGTAYVVGDTLTCAGIATTTGFSPATLLVNQIYDHTNETIQVEGISDSNYSQFNRLYRIQSISGLESITVVPVNGIPGIATVGVDGIGADAVENASERLVGKSYSIDTIVYNNNVGLLTVTTGDPHGFEADNSVVLDGADSNFYNGAKLITEIVGLNTFIVTCGVNTFVPATTGTMRAFHSGLDAQGGDIAVQTENISGRGITPYAGKTVTLKSGITTAATSIDIADLEKYNLVIGDYLKIGSELVRIKTTVNDNGINDTISVFRGVYGSTATSHVANTSIEQVEMYPIELRRNSIIRASGHTFEYVGYGPGNYSTAFPSKQTKQLSPTEQLNAQSIQTNGGNNNYTGMNDAGDYFIGNKKISSNSGKEQVFDTPIQTVTGEDPFARNNSEKNLGLNYVNGDKVTVSRSMVVDGGETNDLLSEFNGPVSFSQKITNTSEDGIETNHLFIQGNANISRKLTVGISTPTLAGNPGDIVYNANPVNGGSVGWVYTIDNDWKTFGTIDS